MDTKFAPIMDTIKDEVTSLLSASGKNAQEAEQAMSEFLAGIQDEIENAIVAGDTMSLNLLRDMAAARAGRTALQLSFTEQQQVSAVISSVVRTVIKFGIAAALA